MRIAVVGSRDYPLPELVHYFIDLCPKDWTLVSGGAPGERSVDRIAEGAADARGMTKDIKRADWSLGRGAGMIRNTVIAQTADAVVAFHDGRSRGTLDTIRKAVKLGRPTIVLDAQAGEAHVREAHRLLKHGARQVEA